MRLIAAIVMGLAVVTAPSAQARPSSPVVTLITGDQVLLRGGHPKEVRPGPGRDGMTFSVLRHDGHVTVIPADALAAVARGRVDRRLFDLTVLRDFGYDRRDTVPLIVTGQALPRGRVLPSIGGVAVDAAKGTAWRSLTQSRGVSRLWLDGKREAVLDHSVPQIGAPAAWAAGYTGDGVTIAVLDSGVDQTHPDLATREIGEANFTTTPDNIDHFGHGTHVASTVAGTGSRYRGVAPGAAILDGKVLDDLGIGQDSWIIAGMEWAAEQGADIVNVSISAEDTPGTDPMEAAVDRLSGEYGTLFVIAAGNVGADGAIGSPGSADAALTVGAVDRDDNLAPFSSRGPRTGDGAIKPDVTAPGVDIVAAQHLTAGYKSMSGTSMAAPHVAGAAALLAQRHPDLPGARLKALLTASAAPNPALTAFAQGSGRVDVAGAITQTVVTEPTNVSIGTIQWPHDDDVPVSKTLTYRNLGTTDVTLALTLDSDLFSVNTDEITVPAGGATDVTVTGDARAAAADGYFSAMLVATSSDSVTRTPVALDREVESYDLTVGMLGADGLPTSAYRLLVFSHDSERLRFPYDEDGSVVLRLPKGRYLVDGTTFDGTDNSMTVWSNLLLDRDTTLTADARAARPVDITPPAGAGLLIGEIGYTLATGGHPLAYSFLTEDLGNVSTRQGGDPLPGNGFTTNINTQWLADDGSYYGLAWYPHGRLPTGFTKVVRQEDLATVRADHGPAPADRLGVKEVVPSPAEGVGLDFGLGLEVALPGTRTEYVTTEGVRWRSVLYRFGTDLEAQFTSPRRTYRAGHTYVQRFNHPVFGPSDGDWLSRGGDTLTVAPLLFSDGAGNAGTSLTDTATLSLYRNGLLVGSVDGLSGSFDVPPDEATYRVTATATRPADVFATSTSVTAEWTFRSTDDVPTFRFTPDVDAARAGTPFLVPVTSPERPRALTVEASYDEGRTWHRAPTILNQAAVVHHPADAETVSLRGSATYRSGDTVAVTVLRAYTLRK